MPRKAETSSEPAAAAVEQPPAYPFLREPAEHGGVVLRNGEDFAQVDMTPEDIAAANDEMFVTSQNLRGAQQQQKNLLDEENRVEGELKAVRAGLRKNEETRLALGDELAVFAEQIHTGKRRVTIQTTHTLTTGNELVITDARDGREIERRTATADEIAEAQRKTASMLTTPAGGGKNPQDELVTVSVAADAFGGKGGKKLAADMAEVYALNDDFEDEGYPVVWLPADNKRSAAIVPRWVASRLTTIVGAKAESIGFRVDARAEK